MRVVKRLAAWLADRRAQRGDELKKTLLCAAREEFAEEFKNSAFDAAYQSAIGENKVGRADRMADNRQKNRRFVYFGPGVNSL